jgi:hypothetical protein
VVNPILSRAAERILARMGEDAFLRGTLETIVNIQQDVEMTDAEGNVAYIRHLARIPSKHAPQKGDTLAVGADNYVLDARVDDDGYFARYVLRKV